MDLSPVSKLSSNFQDLYTAGDREVPVRKSLFGAQSAQSTTSSSSATSPDAFASFSALAELTSSASAHPGNTFKKPLGPSTKLTRAKKLHHSDKRKPGSFIVRSTTTSSSSSLTASSSSIYTAPHPSTSSTSSLLTTSSDDVAAMRRAGRAQSFCFGDRSPLSPIDLDHENRVAAQQPSSKARNLFNCVDDGLSRDTSPYSGQRSVGSCPTSRRACQAITSSTSSKLPTLRLDQLPTMDCDDLAAARDDDDDLYDDDNGENDDNDNNKENVVPTAISGASPYRPPLFQLSPSPSSPSRSRRAGSMTDRPHLRRHNVGLLASDDDLAGAAADDQSFRIHHRGLSVSSAAVPTTASPFNSSGLASSLTSSSSAVVSTSPFAAPTSSFLSTSTSVATSPFNGAEAKPAAGGGGLTMSGVSAGINARRLKMRVGRSLTMSCGSLPALHPMSSATSPSTSTPDMREAHVPVLPTNPHASHSDLPCIEPATLMRLLRGEFDGVFTRLFVIDCRFQYEYDGGHIRGALNLPTTQDVEKYFMTNPIPLKEKVCIIFHCEFSSHRGPVLCRYLRSWDRKMHEHCYPELYYPEMYVLEGGYKKFWETAEAPAFCEPQAYVPMNHSNFSKEMKTGLASIRNFSTKKQGSGSLRSRSWTVDAQDVATVAALRPVRFPRLAAVPSPLGAAAADHHLDD